MANQHHVECINKVRTQLKSADSSIGWIKFKLAGSNGVTGQYIEYAQSVTKKDGTTRSVNKKSFVTHDYCPFCGEKYK